MKRLSYIIIFLVGVVGLLEWLSRGYLASWEPRLRSSIETAISRATQKSVHIDSITFSLPRKIRLVNIRVEDPEQHENVLLSANEIELSLNPVGIPQAILKRKPYLAFGSLFIKEPHLRVNKESFKLRSSASSEKVTLPPWFSLTWEGGTFQLEDAHAPHGQWTLYQSQGHVRILGPQTRVEVKAGIEQARVITLDYSQLGRRWSAKASLVEGHNQDLFALLEELTQRRFLPKGVVLRGTSEAEVYASGREWPRRPADWLKHLDKATWRFSDAPLTSTTTVASLGATGQFIYKNRAITSPRFTLESTWGRAQGSVDIALENAVAHAPISLHAQLATLQIGALPFQNGDFRLTFDQGRWTVSESGIQFMGGRLQPKGSWGAGGWDLAFTAEELHLGDFFPKGNTPPLTGKLNASCTLKGPFDAWQLSGAWWASDAQWGEIPLGNPKGDWSATTTQFQTQGRSDQTKFRLSMAGHRDSRAVEVDQMEVTLPDGANASGNARYEPTRRRLQGSWNASQILLSTDLPFLHLRRFPLKGHVKGQGQFSGPAGQIVHNISAQSDDLRYYDLPLGEVTATLAVQNHRLDIPTFRSSTGIEGQLVNGKGSATLVNAKVGKWTFDRGAARFRVEPKLFELTELTLESHHTLLTGRAKSTWEMLPNLDETKTALTGSGTLQSTVSPTKWNVPFEFSGHLESAPDKRAGAIHLEARALEGKFKGDYVMGGTPEKPEDAFTGTLAHAKWESYPFTAEFREAWNSEGFKPLSIKGRFETGGEFEFIGQIAPDAQAHGSLKLSAFNLLPLSDSLHFPKRLEGLVQATLTVNGAWDALRWSGHISGGPITYASDSPRPYRLEEIALDMTLEKRETTPVSYRLSIIEGQAKTAEELVRFHPRSSIDFAGMNSAKLSLGADLRNLHLGIFTLFGGVVLDGEWQIKPEGFAIQAKTQTRSLFFNDYELEEGAVQADYYNGILRFTAAPNNPSLITGTIDFSKTPQLRLTEVFITGKYGQGLRLNGDMGPALWDFTMDGKGLDLSTLGELAGFPYSLSGEAEVQIQGKGDSHKPHLEGKVEVTRGAAMGLAYRAGRAAFIWQEDRITFTKLLLTDPGRYTLEGSGVFPLRRKPPPNEPGAATKAAIRRRVVAETVPPPIDFSVRLKDSNLSLLQSFSPEVLSAKGPVEGLLQIKGSLDDPSLHGFLKISNGDIQGAHYFRQLRSGNLSLEFDGDTITIKELRGKSGEGEFRAGGKVRLSGFTPSAYDVDLSIVSNKGVEVQVPELAIPDSPLAKRFKFLTTDSRGLVRGHVSLRGPSESPTFSGEALITDGHFTFPPSQKRPPNPRILEWFRRIYWDVNLRFQEGAWFENELVQAAVSGSLALKGPSDQLVVDGGLDIREGRISYLGLQFEIQQARYDLRSEKQGDKIVNRPYVRGVAESRTQVVDTVSGVTGGSRLSTNDTITLNIDYAPIDEIKPRLTSAANPTLSQDKLLARVTQTDSENLTQQERNYLYQKQLVSLIDSSLTTPLAQNVLKKIGIADRLHVQHVFDANAVSTDLNSSNPQQQSSAANLLANTKYTIEKDLSNRLSLGYGVRFIPSAQVDPELQQRKLDLVSDVQLSYRWFSNIYLRGSFDLPNSNPSILPERRVTIEPRWRFGWWGNTNKDKKK